MCLTLARFGVVLASCSVIALFAVIEPAAAETLNAALSQAYKLNPQIDAERARLRATDEEVARAFSGYRPIVTGTADVGYQRTNSKPQAASSGESHPHGYGVNVTQPIFNGFRAPNSVRIAEANVRAGRENLRVTEQTVLLQAVTAYMDVIRDQNIVKLRENNVQVLNEDVRSVNQRFAVGEVTRTDVAQSEARRAAAVSALDLARANLRSSRATYERVIGTQPAGLREPALPRKLLPRSAQDAVEIGTRENPNVVQALYREQAGRLQVDLVWGELLPTVQVEGGYNRRFDASRVIDETEAATVTGRVNVPIYPSGEVQARVRQAKQSHIALLQTIEQVRANVQADAVTAYSSFVAAQAQLISDRAQVEANTIALRGVREEERVGQRTILDVLNAEQDLLNSQVNLVSTQRNVVVAAYTVIVQIGRLNVSELEVTDTVYDPETHYFEVRRKWFGIRITDSEGRYEMLDLSDLHRERYGSGLK
jgi:outer membrane protein